MSSNSAILEVVPLFAIISKSSSLIPFPSSETSNPLRPDAKNLTSIFFDPASKEFSTSSLTALLRSTTT